MKRLFALFSTLWLALSAHASTFVMGTNQALGSQQGWFVWYSGTDSPEGAFMATLKATSNSVTGVIPLGTTIGAGTHYLALKLYDYKKLGSVLVDFGGTSQVITNLAPGGTTGWWTVPVPIVTSIATNSIRLTMQRTTTNTYQQIYLQRGVFISDTTNTLVTSQDVVLNLNVPAIDPSAEIKGNQLDNSGFEVGLGSGWGSQEATARPFPIKTLLDTTIAHDGMNSVKVPNLYQLVSRVYRLRGNRQYTFSAWVSNGVSGHVTLTMANVTPAPTGYPPTSSLATSIAVTQGAWRRVSITTNLLAYPTGDFQFRILGNDPTGGYTWIDSVQVEEGALTAWAPRSDIELGLNTLVTANVFTNGESAAYTIKVRNNGASSTNLSVIANTFDYFNRRLESVTNSVTVPATSTYTISKTLPTGKYGTHRVFSYVDGHENTLDEILFHKQSAIQPPGVAFSSNFGTHTDFTDLEFGTAKKLGINWDRTVSSGSYFRWTIAEPSDDNFVYFDADIAKAASNGIDILGALGVFWPTWADNGAGVPKLDKWTNFVQTIVNHYKPVVHYWEIWNEPQYAFTAAVYGNMLRGAVERIRIEDPTAKIVAFGGVTDYNYAAQVFAYLGGSPSDWGDFASTHQYPLFSPATLLSFYNFATVTNGLPSWNTETGAWSRGYYFGNNSDFIGYDEYAWPHLASYRYQFGGRGVSELLLQNVIRTIGTGYQKYFQYDSRIYVGPAYHETHPTFYDYDDSVRPHGAAYGVFAGMFDYAKGIGQVINTTTTTAYMYQRGSESFASVWGVGSRSLVVPLTDSELRVYDVMGNTNAFGGVLRYGSSPVYLKGLGITTNTLRLALQANSSVASTDVTPPNLSITQWPTGPTTNQPVYLRWMAVDDISLPSSAEPNAITYAYRLDSPTVLGTWSPWTAGTTVALSGLTNDVYTFNVLCQDAAGNSIATSVPITIGFETPVPPPPPPDEAGPLLQLEFDTTVGGTTPNIGSANLTAALTAGAVLGVGHGVGASLSLDGLLSYVVVVPTGVLNFGPTNSFTCSAWVKTPVNRAVTSPILTSQGLFSKPGYTMVILNHKNARFTSRLRDTAGHDTGYIQNFNGVYVNDGGWHHVVIVVDRSIQKMALFTDTVKSALTDITNIGDLTNQMGVFIGGPVFHYKGNIDSVRVYGRALSDADVIALP